MFKSLILVGFLLSHMNGCSNNDNPCHVASVYGFTNCQVTDESWASHNHGCSDDDNKAYEITATNVRGANVNLVVCCGVMKACTLRVH